MSKAPTTIILFLSALGVARADAINSVSCSTPTTAFANDLASCSAVGNVGYAKASVASSVTMPASNGEATQIDVTTNASALLAGIRGITSVSTATSTSNLSINFNTASSVQDGYLKLSFQQNSFAKPTYGSVGELLTIGSYNLNPNGQTAASVFIPIQLGAAFSFDYRQGLVVNGDAGTGPAYGLIGSEITLQAFEADWTTPVELFDSTAGASASTPEPASFGMMLAAAFLALFLLRKMRVRA